MFLGPKGGLLRRNFEARMFKPAVEAAGLPENLTFHGLRHVATTLMIANNEHPKVIQHRLGHADPAMSLGVYGHVPDDLDQATAVRLDDLFRRKPTNEGSGRQIEVEPDQIDRAIRRLQAEHDEPAHEPPDLDEHPGGRDALDDLG